MTHYRSRSRREHGAASLPGVFAFACAVALGGCGGGSGSSAAPVSASSSTSSSAAPSSSSSSTTAASSSSSSAPMGSSPPEVTISVAVSPVRAALAATENVAFAATTNDGAGVSWSVSPSGGVLSAMSSASGAGVTFTAPATPGTYTITAASVTDATKSAAATVFVTDLPGVFTYHNDLARDGANTHEYALSPQDVNTTTFGKLFACTADGAIYAQPLWAPNVAIAGVKHNVVYVATAHDGLYAFDADASPCQTLWAVSLIDANHGGTAGEIAVPAGPATSGNLVGKGNGDMAPEVGVTGTPVIDPTTGTLYVVSKSVVCANNPCSSSGQNTFYQRLHAIDVTTGLEKPGSPTTISATYPGAGDGGTTDTFNAQTQNQRPGLALVNGTVYVAWASHEDFGHYFGWLIAYTYNGSSFTQTVLNIAPNANSPTGGHGAGIWMSGGAPASDAEGNLYLITGNGPFDANSPTAPNNDYGDALIKIAPSVGKIAVSDYFTPSDQALDDSGDDDFGAGGATILADLPAPVQINGAPVTHLVLGGEERGYLYVLNRDKLGGYTGNNAGAIQQITAGSQLTGGDNNGVIYATGAFWNNYFYIVADGQTSMLQAYQLNPATAQLSQTPASSFAGFGFPAGTPSISAQGNAGGIVWVLDNSQFCTPESPGCHPAVLHAFDATNVAKELWNSSMVATDAAGYPVKFTVPTVADGKVYVGTRGNNTGGPDNSTTVPGELDVYGLKPN